MARAPVAALLALAVLLAGCAGGTFVAARVPATLLQGDPGNGWEADPSRSDAAPRGESGGLVQRQTLAYLDDGQGGDGAYPATLSVTTLKLVPTPSEGQLRDLVREQVRERSQQSGIRIDQEVREGGRALGDGHSSLYFVFTGNVTGSGPLFTTRDATAKIVGEVYNCPASGTSVVAVGLAQVARTQRIGGVPISVQQDLTNWRELVGDPRGTIEGQRGADGLLYNLLCTG